jgi:hypothetical protein
VHSAVRMSWQDADSIDRTAKILVDSGAASDFDAAQRHLQSLVLQLAVGPEIEHDPAAQAALVTAVNAGRRAYHGGVNVRLDTNRVLTTGWTAGATASQLVVQYGGTVVDQLATTRPTLVIGQPSSTVAGTPILHLTWNGWSGGVVQAIDHVLGGIGTPPAGVLAAALGISETFQQQLGAVTPGRRDVGVSLWRPDLDWRTDETGPPLQYLPAAVWLLGLGHLGQAYAWTIGMLPYAEPGEVRLSLMDFDTIVQGNTATQLLVTDNDVDRRKTRVVAAALEGRGFTTQLVERAFDTDFHPKSHASTTRNEPTIALAGFDDVAPRRILGNADFTRIVDAGLGAGPVEYLDMVLHTFPASSTPAVAFSGNPREPRPLGSAYQVEIAREVEAGKEEAAARCGILDIAGITVGAAFVGAIASTLVVADILRVLHGGESYSVVALDLRNPGGIQAVANHSAGDFIAPAYTAALMP